MASPSEKRIRIKCEAFLRARYPDARIIHEFVVGGCRLDMAAVTTDEIILLELKSERDVLDRLERQCKTATWLGGDLFLVLNEKWLGADHEVPWSCTTLYEYEGREDLVYMLGRQEYQLRPPGTPKHYGHRWNNRSLLQLLLKDELLGLAAPLGGKRRNDVVTLADMVHEELGCAAIRRYVCAALRARRFGWECDPPIVA